jgi:hypothetical protein
MEAPVLLRVAGADGHGAGELLDRDLDRLAELLALGVVGRVDDDLRRDLRLGRLLRGDATAPWLWSISNRWPGFIATVFSNRR